jgi:hypothetical protein
MKRVALAIPLLLLACSNPVTVVRAVDDRPRILVQGAPQGADLFIDGKPLGQAVSYSGNPGVLLVEPGTHLVEVKNGQKILLSQKLFLGGGEQRTVVVSYGASQ